MIIDWPALLENLTDLLACVLAVVAVIAPPIKAPGGANQPNVEFPASASGHIAIDCDIDFWLVGPDQKPVSYRVREGGCAPLDHNGVSTSDTNRESLLNFDVR
jgi:hypothetical protein